jgi:hypothetical protein
MEHEIGTVVFGVGTGVISWFCRARFSVVPHRISEAGIVAGFLLIVGALVPPDMRPPVISLAFAVVGCLCFGAAVHFYAIRPALAQPKADSELKVVQMVDKPTIQNAPGGIINNQSGGTSTNTVHNYNIGAYAPRNLNNPGQWLNLKKQMSELPKDKEYTFGIPVGAPEECKAFIGQIMAYMESTGHKVRRPLSLMALVEPVYDLEIITNDNGPVWNVRVGPPKPPGTP